jgi:membrane protease YdiL (CAAX protease family)
VARLLVKVAVLTSLLVVVIAAFSIIDRSAFRLPSHKLPRALLVVGGLWLAGVAVLTFATDIWTFIPSSAADYVAFLVVGLLVEELLFRGVIFDLAKRSLPNRNASRIPPWVAVSGVVFGLSHLQFHGFVLSPAALTQVAYTIPLGILLALLREYSGSLWLPIAFHLANNFITLGR